jgi:hypothetical protein
MHLHRWHSIGREKVPMWVCEKCGDATTDKPGGMWGFWAAFGGLLVMCAILFMLQR